MPERPTEIATGVKGTLVYPSAPGVLFMHGWGGNREQYMQRAREVSSLGCLCLPFDLRGQVAGSPERERVSRADNLADAFAAYDLLARYATDIAVIGSSYGAYLAAILTVERPVKWLGLRAPALYEDGGWVLPKQQLHLEQDIEGYRRATHSPDDKRALRACRDFRGDVLIVESECDDTIPHATIASYLEASKQARSLTYRVIRSADHGLSDDDAQHAYTALLVRWLAEMLAASLKFM